MTERDQRAGERAVQDRDRDPDASDLEKSLAMAQGLAEGFAQEAREGNLSGAVGAAVTQATRTVQEGQQGLSRGMPPSEGAGVGATTSSSGGAASGLGQKLDQATAGADTMALLAQQAREAPVAIAAEVRATMREVMGEARTAVLGGIAAVVLGLFGVLMLSYAAALFLDSVWGAPWGFVTVAVVFFLGAALAAGSAKRGAEGVRREAEQGVERVKGEVADRAAAVRGGRRGTV